MAGQWVYSIPNPQGTYDINIRQNSMISGDFLTSDDFNIRQNSMVCFVLCLMISKFNDICFSASDDINIRQNLMIPVFLAHDTNIS